MQGSKIRFPGDIPGGVIGAVSSIPDGMACATMAGLNPIVGLYSTILGPLIGAWTTSSVYMTVTTTGALALALGGALKGVAEEDKLTVATLIALMAGVIQLVISFFNVSILLRFVSNAVLRGFLTGVAVSIILSQTEHFTGNYESHYENEVIKTLDILYHPGLWNAWIIGTGVLTIGIILAIRKTRFKTFSMFIAFILVNIVAYLFPVDDLVLVGEIAPIPKGIPPIRLPDYLRIPDFILSALAIALIGLIQGAGVGHMRPNPDGKYPDDSVDLRGQGISNIVIGLTAGIPVGGSVSTSTLMYSAGVRSRWGVFFSGLFIAVAVFFISSIIEKVPQAMLATILIVTGVDAINKEEITSIWKTSLQSRTIMTFSFLATLALPVQVAVILSVALNFLLHIIREPNRVSLRSIEPAGDLYLEKPLPKKLEKKKVIGILPYGSLFFAGAFAMKKDLPDPEDADRSVVIFSLRGKKELGSTFIKVIKEYCESLQKTGSKLILVGISDNVFEQLERTGMIDQLGSENVHRATPYIGKTFRKVWNEAEEWISNPYT